ncbi:MAG: SLOG family protein [bacterium]
MNEIHFALYTCTFTGHRPDKLPWGSNERDIRCAALKKRIYDAVEAVYLGGIRHYICGMALGCDTYFGEAVLRLREEHPEVTLEAAIPCEDQTHNWSARDCRRYAALVSACDEKHILQKTYTRDCMALRNKYMVDHASVLIAVWSGSEGGTAQTVRYAQHRGLEIIRLAP